MTSLVLSAKLSSNSDFFSLRSVRAAPKDSAVTSCSDTRHPFKTDVHSPFFYPNAALLIKIKKYDDLNVYLEMVVQEATEDGAFFHSVPELVGIFHDLAQHH